jgi:lipopolysaccharide export system permease protein
MLIKTVTPGRFRSLAGGKDVFYVESMEHEQASAKGVFLARLTEKNNVEQWNILWANDATVTTDKASNEDYLVFKHGKYYLGTPGRADYQIASFDALKARLPHPVFTFKQGDLRTMSTRDLWPLNNPNRLKAAELQWRLSLPLMVLALTLVGVPLSRVNPRAGKYASLLPAIVLFFLYANFMFVVRDWLVAGKIPTWLGLWWLHATVAFIGVFLLWRNRVRLA